MPFSASLRARSSILDRLQQLASAFQTIDEMSSRFRRAEIVEILMAAAGKTDELLRLMRQREQAFAEADVDGGIGIAMHDQKRHVDTSDASVGMKGVAHQEPDRREPEQRSRDIDRRGVGRFQDQLADRMLGGNRDRGASAE